MSITLPTFPDRSDDAHKGDVGRLLVIGGRFDEHGMVGAPALTANAALRTGAGLIQVLTTDAARLPISVLAPCATTRILTQADAARLHEFAAEFSADVVAIGPGLSPIVTGNDIVHLMNNFGGPVVVDADGLNALSGVGVSETPVAGRVVLTPHAGELRQLVRGLGLDSALADDGSPDGRRTAADEVARRTNTIVVLKGRGTVVSDGTRCYVNTTGHSGMATGGSGDVLTGVIAALMGQQLDPFDSVVLGVWLHGRAGEIAGDRVGRVSLIATDIVDSIGEAIAECRSQSHDAT